MSRRRSGVTLVEVLVSIFVMGIGLLALLVLFPLGALNMAQAIRSDRCGHIAQNATAFARFFPHADAGNPAAVGVRDDPYVINYTNANPPPVNLNLYTNPNPPPNPPPNLPALTSPYVGPSYPVYIDPFGYFLGSRKFGETPPTMAGSDAVTGFARTSLNYFYTPGPASLAQIARWFTLLDDITFNEDGGPEVPSPLVGRGDLKREGRFSWAFMVKLDDYTKATTAAGTSANLSVVVYDRRPLLAPSTSFPGEMPGEKSFEAYTDTLPGGATVPPNVIVIRWDPSIPPPNGPQDAPAIRKGGWIYDATIEAASTSTPNIHGYFYRVVGVTVPGSLGANSADLEIQTFRKKGLNKGVIVVMENVAEVFDRGTN